MTLYHQYSNNNLHFIALAELYFAAAWPIAKQRAALLALRLLSICSC